MRKRASEFIMAGLGQAAIRLLVKHGVPEEEFVAAILAELSEALPPGPATALTQARAGIEAATRQMWREVVAEIIEERGGLMQ